MSGKRKRGARDAETARGAFGALLVLNIALALLAALLAAGAAVAGVLVGGWALLLGGFGAVSIGIVAVFFAAGVVYDYRATGFSFRREAANAWRRWRRQGGGRQTFASQRFTGKRRRRR